MKIGVKNAFETSYVYKIKVFLIVLINQQAAIIPHVVVFQIGDKKFLIGLGLILKTR